MYLADATPSLGRVYRDVFRHKFKVAGFFAAVMAISVMIAFSMACTYRSQAQLLMRVGRENVTVDPGASPGQVPTTSVPPSLENEINSEIVLLKSQIIAEKVVDALGPSAILGKVSFADTEPAGTEPRERYQAVVTLKNSLQVEAVKKSNIVQISYEGPSPELSRAVVDRIIQLHIDRHSALNNAPRAQQFLADQRLITVNRIVRLEDEMQLAATAKATAEAEVRVLQDVLARSGKTQTTSARIKGVPTPGSDSMQGQLFALQIKEQEMLTRFTEQHPDVQMLHDQIEKARAILAQQDSSQEHVTEGPSKLAEEANLALLKLQPAARFRAGKG